MKRQSNIVAAALNNYERLNEVLETSEQSAGSAMKEQLEYAKSIQYSIDTVKAAFQDFSQTAINSEFIRGVLQMAKSLLEWLDRIVDKIGLLPPILAVIGAYLGAKKGIAILSFIKSLYTGLVGLITATNSAAIATKGLSTAWKVLGNVLVAAAISGVIWALDKLIVTQREAEEEFNNMVDEAYQSTEKYKEEAKELDSLTQKYIDIKNSTADITTKKEQLTSLQEQLVKSYGKEAEGIDLVNGSLEENIKLLNERRKLNAEDYISGNKGKYGEAVEGLGYGYYRVGKNLPDKFRRELEEIASGFDNYNTATGQIDGTLEERLETLKKIRDIYSEQEGYSSKWLSQLEAQIDEYENIYNQLTNIVDEYEKAQEITSITPQQQNIITQATEAYKAYQTALEEGNKSEARNARSALERIKEVMYSITEPTSVLRQDFDEMWAGFNLGSETALSRIAQVKNDFDELSDNFGKSLKNVEKINSAIESMLSGEYLSHDDAWELLKYDTDGVLKDIEIVNGEYKFDTEQLMALMRQKIDLQKTSIQAIKDQAEAERTLLNSQLLRLTTSINSASDYRIYKQKISDINGELKDTENIIDKCGYLLQELNVELGKTEVLTSSTAKQLSATIAAYEDEIKAIEDTIDSLKDRKDILEDEKKQLQEQLEILNKQKEVLEETLKNYDAVADAVADYVKIQTDSIQKQIDALKEQKKLIEDSYDERIKALKAENDERDLALRKEQALIDLANAENQKKKIWSSDRGIEWGTSADDVAKARKTLADIEAEELINALEKEKEEALKGFDEQEKAYEEQIKAFEEYAKKYASIASDIQDAENALLADQILGSNWREKIEKQDEILLDKYRGEYRSYNNELKNLVNNEITALNASIEAKDKEINKIQDEIDAYNKYKDTVKASLDNAKTELENYKNTLDRVVPLINQSLESMEHETWDRNWKIKGYYGEMAEAAENARDRICTANANIQAALEGMRSNSAVLAGVALIGGIVGSHAEGGVNSSTGLAMLHGTKQRSETIFNANDSKKLYDFIHTTPNLIAASMKQATKIAGVNPSSITNNSNASNINVSIGQVVANNPQEFTRNLDTHIDSYFKRKLTQGFVQ